MICVSDIMVASPGFTPGGARKAIRAIEGQGAKVFWYSLTTVLYSRDTPLPGDTPLITFSGDSDVCVTDDGNRPNGHGIERDGMYFFEAAPGEPVPPHAVYLVRRSGVNLH